MGSTQDIPQGEGGEQGDPLMPMLFAFHTVSRPTRVDRLHVAAKELWGGTEPSGVEAITRATRALKPDAVVWRATMLPRTRFLGFPSAKTHSFSISWRPS